MAIALGSRGRGGRSPAAAHYEPGRRVINLTKPRGEGCLAHEWAHALDHYLGNRAAKLGLVHSSAVVPMLSNATLLRGPQQFTESAEAKSILAIHSAMRGVQSREFTREDILQQCRVNYDLAVKGFDEHVTQLMRDLENRNTLPHPAKNVAEEIDRLKAIQMIVTRTDINGPLEMNIAHNGQKRGDAWGDVSRFHLQKIAHIHETYGYHLNHECAPKRVASNYKKACVALDEQLGKKYFSLPHEMFARAFESLVADRLKERGQLSPYLVSGTGGEAFPSGDDRLGFYRNMHAALQELPQNLPAIAQIESEKRKTEGIAAVRETAYILKPKTSREGYGIT